MPSEVSRPAPAVRRDPGPVVALNRAVAVAELDGPAVGLAVVDRLALTGYHAWHATRADLLRRLGPLARRRGRPTSAAIAATANAAERAFLTRRRGQRGRVRPTPSPRVARSCPGVARSSTASRAFLPGELRICARASCVPAREWCAGAGEVSRPPVRGPPCRPDARTASTGPAARPSASRRRPGTARAASRRRRPARPSADSRRAPRRSRGQVDRRHTVSGQRDRAQGDQQCGLGDLERDIDQVPSRPR